MVSFLLKRGLSAPSWEVWLLPPELCTGVKRASARPVTRARAEDIPWEKEPCGLRHATLVGSWGHENWDPPRELCIPTSTQPQFPKPRSRSGRHRAGPRPHCQRLATDSHERLSREGDRHSFFRADGVPQKETRVHDTNIYVCPLCAGRWECSDKSHTAQTPGTGAPLSAHADIATTPDFCGMDQEKWEELRLSPNLVFRDSPPEPPPPRGFHGCAVK